MYLERLVMANTKRIRELDVSFERDGEPRPWTVFIGENGTGKSTVLQAIALAAAGATRANELAGSTSALRSMRAPQGEPMRIEATFRFGEGQAAERRYPLVEDVTPARLVSKLQSDEGERDLRGSSRYLDVDASEGDPIVAARSKELPHWFVAGYGVFRSLPRAIRTEARLDSTTERLRSLFEAADLISTNFMDLLHKDLADAFKHTLRQVLTAHRDTVPDIVDIEMRGRGGVRSTSDLVDRQRFVHRMGDGSELKLPAGWLSHGYQSSIAWLADLVGHLILEKQGALGPAEMEGLVLIDELDLYLHPEWQVSFVRALRTTFPRLQFITTTHSPILLNGLLQDEIVLLEATEEGFVEARGLPFDPRLLTGTQLYARFFGITELHPNDLGRALQAYGYLAANPHRSDEDQKELELAQELLLDAGIDPGFEPVPRGKS